MEDVESSVETEKEDVVSSDVLNISQFVYHVELRQYCQRLQPNTKRPKKI